MAQIAGFYHVSGSSLCFVLCVAYYFISLTIVSLCLIILQMVQTLKKQPNRILAVVKYDIFFDYSDLLDHFYNNFPGGAVQGNHVSWVDSLKPPTVLAKETSFEPNNNLEVSK